MCEYFVLDKRESGVGCTKTTLASCLTHWVRKKKINESNFFSIPVEKSILRMDSQKENKLMQFFSFLPVEKFADLARHSIVACVLFTVTRQP